MSIAEIKNKERVINELMLVLRKIMVEPEICTQALEAAREHLNDEHPNTAIADALSACSNVKIPLEHSEGGHPVSGDVKRSCTRRAGALLKPVARIYCLLPDQ